MILTNNFIFEYTQRLAEIVNDEQIRFPAKVNYTIQKNFNTFLALFNEINKQRMITCQQYSTGVSEDGSFLFEDDAKRASAEQELSELLLDSQEVNIKKFSIDAIEHIDLTAKQMDTLMLMIEDEEEEQ